MIQTTTFLAKRKNTIYNTGTPKMKFAVRDPQTAPTLPALLRYRWSFPKPINVMQHVVSINKVIKGAHNITFKEKKKKKERKTKQNKETNLTTGYTLCDVITEDTIRHDVALITSTSRVHISYPFSTIIN